MYVIPAPPCQSFASSLRRILRDYTDIAEVFMDWKLSMAIAEVQSKLDEVATWRLEGETAHGGFTVA